MTSIMKHFNPSRLPHLAVIIGYLHIFGGIWSSIGAIYDLIGPRDGRPKLNDDVYYESITTITIASIIALVGSLLIIGSKKKLHLMILPWLIVSGLLLVLYFILTAFNFIDFRGFSLFNFALSMINFVIIGFSCYAWLAILTLYHNIRDEKRQSIQNAEEQLCAQVNPDQLSIESYPPAYFIPIVYSDPKLPPSGIKY